MHRFEKLVRLFHELPISHRKREQTFMQISRYPHIENVCSNLLAFFFDTGEAHLLQDLFIKSLLECMGISKGPYYSEGVERESATPENNRIDIVVETGDYVLGIENKLYSGVQNPLDAYEDSIKGQAQSNRKTPLCILLSLRDEEKSVQNTAFQNVTYAKFLQRIKDNLGGYLAGADTKWIVFLNDFIKTIEGLREGTQLDNTFLDFYNANKDEINSMIQAKNELAKSIKVKWEAVKQLISLEDGLLGNGCYYKDDCAAEFWTEHNGMAQTTETIVLDVVITTRGCAIIIGAMDCPPERKEKLKDLLTRNQLKPLCPWPDDPTAEGWKNWEHTEDYFLLERFDLSAAEETIAGRYNEILHTILSL